MAIEDKWTPPVEGGALDLDAGDILTDTVWDGVCSNLLNLGGVDGLRLKNRWLWVPATSVNDGSASYVRISRGSGIALANSVLTTVQATFYLPSDFKQMVGIYASLVPASTGNAYLLPSVAWGQFNAYHENVAPALGSYATFYCGTAYYRMCYTFPSSTYANITGNTVVHVRLNRDATNELDTLEDVLYFEGFLVNYIAQ